MSQVIREAFTKDPTKGKWVVVLAVMASVLVVTLLIWVTLSLIAISQQVTRDSVLTYTVPQHVLSRVSGVGFDGPAIRLGEVVKVTGTKCSSADIPVITFGVTSELTIDPGGLHHTYPVAAALRKPGCVTQTYANTLAPDMEVGIARLFNAGFPFVTVRISGFETPVDQHYSTAEWYTDDFRVYPPLPGSHLDLPSSTQAPLPQETP